MRVIIIYIWLITITLPTFSQWGTIAYYQVNRAYIARVLCQNRDKPQLDCNGHCYLAKMLREQQEKDDQKTGEQVQNIPILQLFTSPVALFTFLSAHILQRQKVAFPYELGTYLAPLSIAVPPPCL